MAQNLLGRRMDDRPRASSVARRSKNLGASSPGVSLPGKRRSVLSGRAGFHCLAGVFLRRGRLRRRLGRRSQSLAGRFPALPGEHGRRGARFRTARRFTAPTASESLSVGSQLFDGLVIGEQVNHAQRRVVVEEQLVVPVSLRSSGRAAGKEVSLIRDERAFNVTWVGGDGLTE
jgi:hypothetical protein